MDRRLLLLDSHAMIFRAFYAIRQEMTNALGEPVNAVHGFGSMLLTALREARPTHVVIATDVPGRTFRDEACERYKAHRAAPPDALISQIPLCHGLARAAGIPVIGAPGFEADDVIGTLAPRAAASGFLVTIGTGDRDALQLVDEKISVMTLDGDAAKRRTFTPRDVLSIYGCPPERLPLWKAIAGDSSDNIAGIPGLGPKAATTLASEFASFDEIFAAAEAGDPRITGSLRTKLLDPSARDAAAHGLLLATIRRDVPVSFVEADAEVAKLRVGDALAFLSEHGLRALSARFARDLGEKAPPIGDEHARTSQLSLF